MLTEAQKKAIEHAVEKIGLKTDKDGIADDSLTLFLTCFLLRLGELDPGAVKITYIKGKFKVFLLGEFPWDCYEYCLEDLPEDFGTYPTIIEISCPDVLTQKDAANFCGVTPRALQGWRKKGLRSFPIGRKTVYLESDLEQFMK